MGRKRKRTKLTKPTWFERKRRQAERKKLVDASVAAAFAMGSGAGNPLSPEPGTSVSRLPVEKKGKPGVHEVSSGGIFGGERGVVEAACCHRLKSWPFMIAEFCNSTVVVQQLSSVSSPHYHAARIAVSAVSLPGRCAYRRKGVFGFVLSSSTALRA